LPWSTTAAEIFIYVWLAVRLLTLDMAALRQELSSAAGGLPVLLFIFAAGGMLWAQVSFAERLSGLTGFIKLLFIPLLLMQFRRSERGHVVLYGFLASCTTLLVVSWIQKISLDFGQSWAWIPNKMPGVPVKDYIAQSSEFLVCAFTLLGVAVDRAGEGSLETAEVRAAIGGVLAVDEGIKSLAVTAVAVRETEFERLAGVMERGIERFGAVAFEIFEHEIHEAEAGLENSGLGLARDVQNQLQAAIEVTVMAQAALDVFLAIFAFLENIRVLLELNEGAVGLLGFAFVFFLELALFEGGLGEFTIAMAADEEKFREGVDGLGAHAVQADTELEHVVVVFRAGVDFGNAIHDLAERNAAAEIAHGDAVALDVNLHLFAVAHDEFIDSVIEDFLHQDVAAVVGIGAVADAPDIHAGAEADVLQRRQGFDLALVVIVFRVFSHSSTSFRVV